jgi:hypothetical protein
VNNLADFLTFVVSMLQSSPLCKDVQIIETQIFSDNQFFLKVRAELRSASILQIRLYINRPHIDYAYQIVLDQTPIMRWDNKEHFPSISSFPHHFHQSDYKVVASPLIGDPEHDLPLVLELLRKLL